MPIPDLSRLSRLTAPAFKLSVDGLSSSPALNDRLVGISVTLNNGKVSDQLSLILDDRPMFLGSGISLPRAGATISVSLGYEAYLELMGEFIVNHVSLSGSSGGRTLSVSATPALLSRDVIRTWGNKTIGDIVATIASEHQLKAKVSPTLKQLPINEINQSGESNSAFLTRLAARYNAVCKPMAGNLLFMEKGEGTSASGFPMPAVDIAPHDVIQWSKQLSERQSYQKVYAYWFDYIDAEAKEICVSSGSSQQSTDELRLPYPYNNEDEAKAAATAKLEEVTREDESLTLTSIGNPKITAEGKITLSNFRNGVDGEYIVKSVTHNFSQGGYETSLQAYVEPNTKYTML